MSKLKNETQSQLTQQLSESYARISHGRELMLSMKPRRWDNELSVVLVSSRVELSINTQQTHMRIYCWTSLD